MHPPIGVLLFPLFLAHDIFTRYAVAAWGLLIVTLMLVACTPSWSEEAAYLPAEWPVALALYGLIVAASLSWSFWRWYARNHEPHGPPVRTDDNAFDMGNYIILLGVVFAIAFGMLLIGRLHM